MIIIAPYAQKLRNGGENPKNYPLQYWKILLEILDKTGEQIVQVGMPGEYQLVTNFVQGAPLGTLASLIEKCRTWISVDSFFQHMAWAQMKPGVVLFAQSDPLIFGHPENINLLKSRAYLRPNQFLTWEQAEYNIEAYIDPKEVAKSVLYQR